MSTSRYFRGVKLEDPSVTACRNELLARSRSKYGDPFVFDKDGRSQRETVTARADRGRARGVQARVIAPPPAAPSVFRALRPGDQIVKPPSPTKAPLTQAPASSGMIPPEPVAAILARRRAAADRMAVWLRGGAPSLDPAVSPPDASAAAVPTKRTEADSGALTPEPLADVFARRRAAVKAARPWMRED